MSRVNLFDVSQMYNLCSSAFNVFSNDKMYCNDKSDCYFCGSKVDVKSADVCRVMTLETQETVLSKCNARRDTWAEVVKARILYVHDLPAAEAVYHKICNSNFRTDKQVPASYVKIRKENEVRADGRTSPLHETRTQGKFQNKTSLVH